MNISRAVLSLGFLSVFSGCTMVDPFTRSNEAMMAKVAEEIPLGSELKDWLNDARGKKVILVNMEDDRYTDDQLPEYMIHDALYSRLTDDDVRITLLERDIDTLTILERESDGVDLPAEYVEQDEDNKDEQAGEIRQGRRAVADMIYEVLEDLAPQDVLVLHEETCCADKSVKGNLETKIVANEVGQVKADLLRDLVTRYANLYPTQGDTSTKKVIKAERKVIVDQADFLLAYRIYDFGTWTSKADRLTYIKLHIRIVDMSTGAIVASDFLEHKVQDRLSRKEQLSLAKSHNANQSDYGRPGSRTRKNGRSSNGRSSGTAGPAGAPGNYGTTNDGVIKSILKKVKGFIPFM